MDASPMPNALRTPASDVISTPAKQRASPGWGQIAHIHTPASAKRKETKARVQRFVRAGRPGPSQAQPAGPTAQSILSVKRTLSFNVWQQNADAGPSQQPPSIGEPKKPLENAQQGACQPGASEAEPVPTTLAAHLKEAMVEESGSQVACKSRHSNPVGKMAASRKHGVRDGGHENFVRMASKKGKSSFTFKSKSGSSNRNPKNRKWAARKMAAESLPVAGLGADSTKEASLICFKCGQKGHWAADCKAELPTGQKEHVNMAWCVTDTELLDTTADPLPAFLQHDAVVSLAAQGAISDAYLSGSDFGFPDLHGPDDSIENMSQNPGMPVDTVECDRKASSVDDTLRHCLREVLGFEDFRSFQLPVICQLLQKESCLVVQPTGSGKSLCFQLPALLLPGLVLVVSPLTAHVRDAVSRLHKSVPAGICLGGDFKRASMATLAAAEHGRLKLLYITPECLATSWVSKRLSNILVSLVCVDEAHVASAMSPGCRPGCLRLPSLISSIAPDAAKLLLTATAAPAMCADLASVFGVSSSSIWTAAPLRPELTMRVEKQLGSAGDARSHSAVLAALAPNGPLGRCKCILVYCTFCAQAEQLASYLQGRGLAAAAYYGSMSGAARQAVAERLAAGKLKVVTCTTALSSGLDLHNVDGVLHNAMPASLEDYVQQIGRAGRAGQPSSALVLLRDADLQQLHSLKHTTDCDLRAVQQVLRTVLAAATEKVVGSAETKTAAKKRKREIAKKKKSASTSKRAKLPQRDSHNVRTRLRRQDLAELDSDWSPSQEDADLMSHGDVHADESDQDVADNGMKLADRAKQESERGTYVVLQLREAAIAAQVTVDTIQTMLSMLEKAAPNAVRVLGNVIPSFKVACYKRTAEEVAEREPLFAAIQSVARVRNGTLSAKTQDVARAAHIAPDAVEDVLQRLAAEGEVHLEAKRDFSVALWVDPASHEWQSLSERRSPGDGTSSSGGLAQGVLASMTELQNTLVKKVEFVYQALNSVQQLPPSEQSDALAAYISNEFPACTENNAALVHRQKSISMDLMLPVQAVNSNNSSDDTAPCTESRSDDLHVPNTALGIADSVEHGNAPCAATDRELPGLPFEPVGKMTAIRVAATVEHAAMRAGEKVHLTARAIASIMHGRDTPAFPRSTWSKCPGWGTCMHVKFAELRSVAQNELLKQAGINDGH